MSGQRAGGGQSRARPSLLLVVYLCGLLAGAAFAAFALAQLRSTSESLGSVISEHTDNALDVERLTTFSERLGRLSRSYLLTGDVRFRTELAIAREELSQTYGRLRARVHDRETER